MTDTNLDWLQETRALIAAAPRELTLTKIAKDCDVSIAWLSKFASGQLKDPGILNVQKVNRYLKQSANV